jgi:hypothetical protein
MKCPTCNAPVSVDEKGMYFDQGLSVTEEIMIRVLKQYPDMLAPAIQWSKEHNSPLWQTVKEIMDR